MNRHHARRWLCVVAYAAAMAWVEAAVQVAGRGSEAIRNVLPEQFNWPLFLVALARMAAPVVEVWRRVRSAAAGAVPAAQCQ